MLASEVLFLPFYPFTFLPFYLFIIQQQLACT